MTDDTHGRRPDATDDVPADAPLSPAEDSVPPDLAVDVYTDEHPPGVPDPNLTDAPIADDRTPEGAMVDLEQSVERAVAVRGGFSWATIVGLVALVFLIAWIAIISL